MATDRNDNAAKEWLQLHGASERRLVRAIHRFFREQARRIIKALKGAGTVTTDTVPLIFDEKSEHQRFMDVVRPHLAGMMAAGAKAELDRLPKELEQETKGNSPRHSVDFLIRLPAEVLDEVYGHLSQVEEEDYWESIQAGTKTKLSKLIGDALKRGDSNYKLGKSIWNELGGAFSKARANAIARTETTGALNAGHHAAMAGLAQKGMVLAKVWLTIGDRHVRDTHQPMHGKQVKVEEDFLLPRPLGGNESAPFPGWWGLSPENRVRCRCTIISVTVFDGEIENSGNGEESADVDELALQAARLGLGKSCSVHAGHCIPGRIADNEASRPGALTPERL